MMSQLNLTSFDFIIPEVFLPLLTGGTSAIPSTGIAGDVIGAIEALSEAGVSVIQLVPTVMGRFLRVLSASPTLCSRLNAFKHGGRMICNGEALPDPMRRLFYRLFPDSYLHNCYGPTEACVAVTEYLCPKGEEPQTMYIGTPVPNVSLYILDQDLREVSVGTAGELFIGGVQTGIGYVGNPTETSTHFLEVTTSDGPSRVYRTGDIVRVSENGLVEFLGRDDTQMKYRSLRLEPGEIESVALMSGLCEDARLVVTEGADENLRQDLLLFVSPLNSPIHLLELYLRRNLPKDRQPTQVISLEVMPTNERGKLDRTELIALARVSRRMSVVPIGEHRVESVLLRSDDRVDILLRSICEVTQREYSAEDLWPVEEIDSLAFIDLEVSLLERGLRFRQHANEMDGLTLGTLARDLLRVAPEACE